ncbi:MAG: cupin domain-containing protein [Desulfovibrionaceae bacterium]|nr:cupin domain-containing protein [Desulfovibrionaceae bacterium]
MTAQDIIEHYKLSPHPEGGFYRRTYAAKINTDFRNLSRPVSTAILFLLREGQYSRLHRLPQDEMWHFYLGGPLRLVSIGERGEVSEVILGPNILGGECLQYLVPAGFWFGATPVSGSAYSLVGCTVSPGFCMEELEFLDPDELLRLFPGAKETIQEFS